MSQMNEERIFSLIASLIEALNRQVLKTENLGPEEAVSTSDADEDLQYMERIDQNLLFLFNQMLGGNAEAIQRAIKYVEETSGVSVDETFLEWLEEERSNTPVFVVPKDDTNTGSNNLETNSPVQPPSDDVGLVQYINQGGRFH